MSLAPSVTEVLFEVGLGDRVVGVTRYCDHPPQAADRPRIGGYLDVSFEAVVALEPDLVIGIRDSAEALRRLRDLGLETLQVDQRDVAEILTSIVTIGDAAGAPDRGRRLSAEIGRRIERVRSATAGLARPRALVVVDRALATGDLRTVWVAGPSTFYDGLLEIAGGRNAVDSGRTAYPELSREGLLAVDPEVIIEVAASLDARGLDPRELAADWFRVDGLAAVRAGRVSVLDQEWMVIPGPRVALIVEQLATALHPGLELATDG